MKSQLWKNQISDNLKNALVDEINNILPEKIKEINKRNKELLSLCSHQNKLIKRLKKTLARIQKTEIYNIKIDK